MLLIAASACSKQGEGERCDLANFDEDCESGLVCTDLSTKRSNAEGAVCCAPDSTINVCLDDKFSFEDDAGSETSAPSSPTSDDSSSVIQTDAGADASTSAPETSSSSEPNQTVVDAGESSSSTSTSSSEPTTSSADTSSAPDAAAPDAG